MNQRLLRFDVRLHKDDYVSSFWDAETRGQFLLRPEVEWPLAVDPLVWPSVFYTETSREATSLRYGSIAVDFATDDGDRWLDLEQMKTHFERYKRPNTRGVPIAISLFSEKSLSEDWISYTISGGIECALVLGHTRPSELPDGSELLGFDVADGSRISGLTNCGYTPEDKLQLQPKWLGRLNDFGLLKTCEDAQEFRDICDTRVAEHAPFWIYGIYRLSNLS